MRPVTAFLVIAALLQSISAQIRIVAPQWLATTLKDQKGRIDGTTATFGAPSYGVKLLGRLVWGESKRNKSHCEVNDYTVPPPTEEIVKGKNYSEVRLINIILVRRGLCSFVQKVRVATKKGAHAVIFVDSEDSTLTGKDIQKTIVSDDGHGEDIRIPSILISKQEGQKLIDGVKRSSQVLVELAWNVPTNRVVVMDFWMSSGSQKSQKFLQEFSPKRKVLDRALSFVPHYHVFALSKGGDNSQMCTDSSAQFCAEDPDGAGKVTGKMVIEENLRQLCIHEKYRIKKVDRDNPNVMHVYAEKYWDYVERFPLACPLEADLSKELHSFTAACSQELMKTMGIDADRVQRCVMDTRDAKLLEQRESKAWSPNALRINGWRYDGMVDADLVTRAICVGFTKPPLACKEVSPGRFSMDARLPPLQKQGVSMGTLFFTLIWVAGLSLCGLQLYKRFMTKNLHRQLRDEVHLEVQAQMASYKRIPH